MANSRRAPCQEFFHASSIWFPRRSTAWRTAGQCHIAIRYSAMPERLQRPGYWRWHSDRFQSRAALQMTVLEDRRPSVPGRFLPVVAEARAGATLRKLLRRQTTLTRRMPKTSTLATSGSQSCRSVSGSAVPTSAIGDVRQLGQPEPPPVAPAPAQQLAADDEQHDCELQHEHSIGEERIEHGLRSQAPRFKGSSRS